MPLIDGCMFVFYMHLAKALWVYGAVGAICWDQRCSKPNCGNLLLPPLFCCCPSAEGYHSHSSVDYLSYHQREHISIPQLLLRSLSFVAQVCFHWLSIPGAARLVLRNEQSFNHPSFHKLNVVPWKCSMPEHQCGCCTGIQWNVLKWRISFRNLLFSS